MKTMGPILALCIVLMLVVVATPGCTPSRKTTNTPTSLLTTSADQTTTFASTMAPATTSNPPATTIVTTTTPPTNSVKPTTTTVFNLNVSINPSGSGTVKPLSGNYARGEKVALTATAVFPYAFASWSSADNPSINPTTITIGADTNVVANFRQLNPGPTQTLIDDWNGNDTQIPITLIAGQWVKGEIQSGYSIHFSILDPAHEYFQDLGTHESTAFTFQAQRNGTYYLDLGYALAFEGYEFKLSYNVYS
jgi:hypothetical protein